MVEYFQMSNGVWFSKGWNKMDTFLFGFHIICADFKYFGFVMAATIAMQDDYNEYTRLYTKGN